MWLLVLLLLSIIVIIVATAKFRMHPFLALLLASFFYGILCGKLALVDIVNSINAGFGGTIGYIGIVIVAGSIIGTFLEKSGGAYRLAVKLLGFTGEKNVPMAMSGIGAIVSIPVFCDSGFIILSPLNKALSKKAKISLAGSAVALSLGLYATHTMVPPTPGPVAAAGLLGADLGLVILWGAVVSVIAIAAGWLFAVKVASKIPITVENEPSESDISIDTDAPSAFKSLLPILLPIILIVLKSISDLPSEPFGAGKAAAFFRFVGQPVVALLLGVIFAFGLPKKFERKMLSTEGWVGQSLVAAATIIVITGTGGAFGRVLKDSGIADVAEQYFAGVPLGIWLPFFIAATLKTAQGSSTVAITTTAGIMIPLLEPFGLDGPTARALVVVAIGAGSMVVSHANDSYFWVVTQFSGMTVKQGYKLQTLGTLVEGGAAIIAVWVISLLVL